MLPTLASIWPQPQPQPPLTQLRDVSPPCGGTGPSFQSQSASMPRRTRRRRRRRRRRQHQQQLVHHMVSSPRRLQVVAQEALSTWRSRLFCHWTARGAPGWRSSFRDCPPRRLRWPPLPRHRSSAGCIRLKLTPCCWRLLRSPHRLSRPSLLCPACVLLSPSSVLTFVSAPAPSLCAHSCVLCMCFCAQRMSSLSSGQCDQRRVINRPRRDQSSNGNKAGTNQLLVINQQSATALRVNSTCGSRDCASREHTETAPVGNKRVARTHAHTCPPAFQTTVRDQSLSVHSTRPRPDGHMASA